MQTENNQGRPETLEVSERQQAQADDQVLDTLALSEPEMITLSTLVCVLVFMRGAQLEDLSAYVDQPHDALPFEGCERALFDVLIAALRERGHAADEIARFIETHALVAGVAMAVG